MIVRYLSILKLKFGQQFTKGTFIDSNFKRQRMTSKTCRSHQKERWALSSTLFKKEKNAGLGNTKTLVSVILAAAAVATVSFGLSLAPQSDRDGSAFLTGHSPDDMAAVPSIPDVWSVFDSMPPAQLIVPAFAIHAVPPTVDTGFTHSFKYYNEGVTVTIIPDIMYDGTDTLIYRWHQQNFDFITDPNSLSTTFTLPQVDEDEIEFIFFDVYYNDDDSHEYVRSFINIWIVNVEGNPPVVDVGPDQTVDEGETVSIPWTVTDGTSPQWSDGSSFTITYDNPNSSPTTFTAPQVDSDTTITITLTATNDDGSGDASMRLTIRDAATVENNHPPTVNAGLDQTVNERTTVTLSGSANDPDTGDRLTYKWSQDSGTSVSLTGDDTASPRFAAPGVTSEEELVFRLTVTDAAGKFAEDTVTVKVKDVPISVSSATYTPGSGQLRITFNQDISLTHPPVYSSIHIRSTGDDSVGILLSDVVDKSYSGRTITATLSPEQQETYKDLQSPHLDIASGAVTDVDGAQIVETSDVVIRTPSKKKSSSVAPIVDLGTLARAGIVDIPPYISEQVASHPASDPLGYGTTDGAFDLPLVINGQGYLLDGLLNTLVPHTVVAGQPAKITFTVYSQNDLAHFTLYLNLQDSDVNYSGSDTYIRYTIDGTVTVTDPHGYIADDATITVTEDDNQIPEKKTVRITIKFEEPMGPTNMVAYMWNLDGKATIIRMIDALDVVPDPDPLLAVDPEPAVPDSELQTDQKPTATPDSGLAADSEDGQALLLIRTWSGFELGSVTDDQLIELLGLDDYLDADIPNWVMTELGALVAKNLVTIEEFRTALEYVLENS